MPSEAPAPWRAASSAAEQTEHSPGFQPGSGAGTRAAPAELPWQSSVDELVRLSVLPRLGLAFAERSPPAPRRPAGAPMPVAALREAIGEAEITRAASLVDQVRRQGAALESICDSLLVPVARKLCAEHDSGQCDDGAFALGQARLVMLMNQLPWPPHFASPGGRRTALVMLAAEAADGFEPALVLHKFDQAGWIIRACGRQASEAVEHLLHASWCSLVWIGVGPETPTDGLGHMIRGLRRSSRNPALGVVCGMLGPAPKGRRLRPVRVGADAVAETPAAALPLSETVLRIAQSRH